MNTDTAPLPRVQITGGNAPIPEQLDLYYEQLELDVQAALQTARDDMPPTIESDDDVALVANYVKLTAKPLRSRIEAAEELEKRPLMNATDAVRAFFRAKDQRLEKAIAVLSARVKSYQDAVAAKARAEAAERARILREAEEAKRREAAEAQANADRAAQADASEQARIAAIRAHAAEKQAAAKGADHARVKSSEGAIATVQTFWTHEVQDLQAIPPAMLWPFVSDQAKLAAIAAFVKAGNRELPGVKIFEDTRPAYR